MREKAGESLKSLFSIFEKKLGVQALGKLLLKKIFFKIFKNILKILKNIFFKSNFPSACTPNFFSKIENRLFKLSPAFSLIKKYLKLPSLTQFAIHRKNMILSYFLIFLKILKNIFFKSNFPSACTPNCFSKIENRLFKLSPAFSLIKKYLKLPSLTQFAIHRKNMILSYFLIFLKILKNIFFKSNFPSTCTPNFFSKIENRLFKLSPAFSLIKKYLKLPSLAQFTSGTKRGGFCPRFIIHNGFSSLKTPHETLGSMSRGGGVIFELILVLEGYYVRGWRSFFEVNSLKNLVYDLGRG